MGFFELSKIGGFVLEPLNALFLALLLVLALLRFRRPASAQRLLAAIVALLALQFFVPIGALALRPLETRFPAPAELPAQVDGIIMLGGAQQPRLTRAWGQPALNGHAERMTTFLALARRYPGARLVFSGGSGDPLHQEVEEADTVRLFLREQGFDPARVSYESTSRNTWENAVHSRTMVSPRPGEAWLLVTSAADLPRAIGAFRGVGWPVTPVPCDYNTLPIDWTPGLSLLDSFEALAWALHEWAGLVAYFATGKSAVLFPAP